MEEMLEPRKPAQVTSGDLDDSSESVVNGELAVERLAYQEKEEDTLKAR